MSEKKIPNFPKPPLHPRHNDYPKNRVSKAHSKKNKQGMHELTVYAINKTFTEAQKYIRELEDKIKYLEQKLETISKIASEQGVRK